jgi:hypothetical protein
LATVWLTYAWKDNEGGDVDFVAQELRKAGIEVNMDRWSLRAGERLWGQIAGFIQDEAQSDAWVLFATQRSLGSEACREEVAYALDRALGARGEAFPIIGLFNGPFDETLVPAAVRVRLCVSISEPGWEERIRAAAEGRDPVVQRPHLDPFEVRIHPPGADGKIAIELRPRAGTWSPFAAAVPWREKDHLNPVLLHGPAGRLPQGGVLMMTGEGKSGDGQWWFKFAQNEATPTQSYYLLVNAVPSKIVFGVHNAQPQFSVEFNATRV